MLKISDYQFDPNLPSLYEEIYPNPWQMTRWEKFAFISLIEKLRPEVAIEIGNAQGGSLQVLSKYCKKVYALDFSEEVHTTLKKQFTSNVEFYTGDSKELLPKVLQKITANGEKLGFVLIDGDHSTEGVKADINNILQLYKPITDMVIIFHDSFNPICRKGIVDADWSSNLHVEYVDIDFVPGNFFKESYKSSEKGSLWGGLSFALLRPDIRTGEITVRQSLKPMYEQMLKGSRYNSLKYRLRVFWESLTR